jgi:hypothetical protein
MPRDRFQQPVGGNRAASSKGTPLGYSTPEAKKAAARAYYLAHREEAKAKARAHYRTTYVPHPRPPRPPKPPKVVSVTSLVTHPSPALLGSARPESVDPESTHPEPVGPEPTRPLDPIEQQKREEELYEAQEWRIAAQLERVQELGAALRRARVGARYTKRS